MADKHAIVEVEVKEEPNSSTISPAHNKQKEVATIASKVNHGKQSDHISINIQDSEESGNSTDSNDKSTCRICFRGRSYGTLLVPCECKGTMAYVHQSCLEQWLTVKDSDECDICHVQFLVTKTEKSFVDWFKDRNARKDHCRVAGYLFWLLLSTPLIIHFVASCMDSAIAYSNIPNAMWDATILAALGTLSAFVQALWIVLAARNVYRIVEMWKRQNLCIRMVYERNGHYNSESDNSLSSSASEKEKETNESLPLLSNNLAIERHKLNFENPTGTVYSV